MKSCVDIARAREMREQGMTLKQIGDEFGVTRERIRQLVGSPPREKSCDHCSAKFESGIASQRFCSPECAIAAQRRVHGECDGCGTAVAPNATRCVECHVETLNAATDDRRRRICDLWATGATLAEIAEEVGTTANALGVEFVRMRRAGWDLPYRRAKTPSPPATKQQARDQLGSAVANGLIRRPARCEHCGAKRHVDGHHVDYSRALYVEWLCRSCHLKHHAAERSAA